MANNVGNKLTIKCQDHDTMERIKKMIFRKDKNNNQEFTMEILLSRSMAFADAENNDLNWNSAVWGTKSDVYDWSVKESGNTIILLYNTALWPNLGWVEVLCSYIGRFLAFERHKYIHHLVIEHMYFHYSGNFGGIVEWKPSREFAYKYYDFPNEYLKNYYRETYERMLELEEQINANKLPVMKISLPTKSPA